MWQEGLSDVAPFILQPSVPGSVVRWCWRAWCVFESSNGTMSWWEGYEEELLLCSKAVEKHSNEFSPPEKLFNILREMSMYEPKVFWLCFSWTPVTVPALRFQVIADASKRSVRGPQSEVRRMLQHGHQTTDSPAVTLTWQTVRIIVGYTTLLAYAART